MAAASLLLTHQELKKFEGHQQEQIYISSAKHTNSIITFMENKEWKFKKTGRLWIHFSYGNQSHHD
ncbi:hypothetical protein D1970_18000 [Mesobacillus zeae]|uniref:Uncharacterized protein n=1 Tax=Mesobacillus zeae TaxID=1917180 RepID=A0A398B0H5_9BACI|nr:hypothetical protein D1970_18000 [Mesobacillus zeae]